MMMPTTNNEQSPAAQHAAWTTRRAALTTGKNNSPFFPHRLSVASVETTHTLPRYNDDTVSRSRGLGVLCSADAPPGYEHDNDGFDSLSDKSTVDQHESQHESHESTYRNKHIRCNVTPGSTVRYSIDVSCDPAPPLASSSKGILDVPSGDMSDQLDRLIALSNNLLDSSNSALDSSMETRRSFAKFTNNVESHVDRSVRRCERSVRHKLDLVDERSLWSERLDRDLADGPSDALPWKQYHQDSLEVGRQVMAVERAALLARASRDLGASVATLRPKKHSAPVRSASRAVPRYGTLHVNIDALPGPSVPSATSSSHRPHLASLFPNDTYVASPTENHTPPPRSHTRTASDLLNALVSTHASAGRQKPSHRSVSSTSSEGGATASPPLCDEDFVDVFGEIKATTLHTQKHDSLNTTIPWSPNGAAATKTKEFESPVPLARSSSTQASTTSTSTDHRPSLLTSIPPSPSSSRPNPGRLKPFKPRSSLAHVETRQSHHRTLTRELYDLVKEDPSLRRSGGSGIATLSDGNQGVSSTATLLKNLFSNPTR